MGRLQQQLREALGAAGSHKAAVEARLRQAEVEWQQQLAEARERAKQAEAELSSRCQMLSIEKVAHEQAANRATAEQRAAEARCEAAEARCRQLAAELGDASGAAAQVQAARQQAEAAAEAARSLRRQLLEREARCEELEGALRGEQERRHSQAARAATAEVAQAGLGSHVKATHARLQQLQVRLDGRWHCLFCWWPVLPVALHSHDSPCSCALLAVCPLRLLAAAGPTWGSQAGGAAAAGSQRRAPPGAPGQQQRV